MILLFGGTTEGRVAAHLVDEGEKPFYYSTQSDQQLVPLESGIRLCGALDEAGIIDTCRRWGIRLMIDAAHPFAQALHANVSAAAQALGLPLIRYDRIYPQWDKYDLGIHPIHSQEEVTNRLLGSQRHRLLSLGGVSSIPGLWHYWRRKKNVCYFRILDRDESRQMACDKGLPDEYLLYDTPDETLDQLLIRLKPDMIYLKESGISSGFSEKVETARRHGIDVYFLEHPRAKDYTRLVNGELGLRLAIDELLPDFFALHLGYTTGTCACAAACLAMRRLFHSGAGGTEMLRETVKLPNGESISLPVKWEGGTTTSTQAAASASVVKRAGSDPDVTNGAVITATVAIDYAPSDAAARHTAFAPSFTFFFHAGKGVGTVTLPGLGLDVGEPAINEGPRQMIVENLLRVMEQVAPKSLGCPVHITLSVKGGKELAERTFNPRLGIEGGLSILGTSGVVRPFSDQAFIDAIRKELSVAKATGAERVVLNSGAKSERLIGSRYPALPAQAFVHYGNFIGEALKLAAELEISRVTLGLMLGKAVKLAEGQLDTHSKVATMNLAFLVDLAEKAGCTKETMQAIGGMTLARELWTLLPDVEQQRFFLLLTEECYRHCRPLLPGGELTITLLREEEA
ncbi:MAG: cobalt-precorrin-5B (C(1))-methyltransferase CbiD [Bacteroides sp.]